jgi:putative ABC transport system permease protein
VVNGGENWATKVQGVTPDYFVAREWGLAHGRGLSEQDLKESAKVAFLGQTVAERLFGAIDPVGRTVRVATTPFTVVGLLAAKGHTSFGQDQDDRILVRCPPPGSALSARAPHGPERSSSSS